jgi:hypothetical protein
LTAKKIQALVLSSGENPNWYTNKHKTKKEVAKLPNVNKLRTLSLLS